MEDFIAISILSKVYIYTICGVCTLSDLNHTDSARSCWITVFSDCKMKECYFTFSPGLLSSQKPSASVHDIFPSVECWSVRDICYIPS